MTAPIRPTAASQVPRPRADGAHRRHLVGTFMLPSQNRSPLRILLVEDSRADSDLLVAMLEDELPEAIISVSKSVEEAVPLLAGPLDIAITDLSLPDAEGLQALSAILTARPDIAVVVMTGRQDRELALRALSEGAEDYLIKGSNDASEIATAVLYAAERRNTELGAHRYERLALSLLDAMEAATCAVDRDGTIIAVNNAWRGFVERNGGDPAVIGVGMAYLDACRLGGGPEFPEDTHAIGSALRQLLDGVQHRFQHDYPRDGPAGRQWMSLRVNALPDSGAVLSHVDVSATKQAEQAISHLSMHDPLTNLPNRQLLADRLEQALAVTSLNSTYVGVGFLDIDQFKRINDSLGHPAGDELLCSIADRLRDGMRAGDTVARYAGDEFVIVWPGLRSVAQAERLGERLAEELSAPFVLQAATVSVTASVGVVVGRTPQQADELLLSADAAMYHAKSNGRGLTRSFTEELRLDVASRLRTEEEIRIGLQRNEFVLHYQPVVDLRSRTVTGVEALARWQHPDGMRMPDSFIPVAEATGLMVPLGEWVLREACRQGAAWESEGSELEVAVNFSARQISDPRLLTIVNEALAESKMRPELLWAEVTESSLMEDAALAQEVFAQISSLGAAVAIDDFGTGYSSLLYLKQYPVSALKVDRHFVAGMGINDDDDAIVSSVISLAHAVGAVCIAEGVETVEQYARLRALGCDYAQGYLFGRPVAAGDLPAALRRSRAVLEQAMPVLAPARGKRDIPLPPAAVVTRIEELHHAGASLHTIAATLNREKWVNPSGLRWRSTSVAKVVATRLASN